MGGIQNTIVIPIYRVLPYPVIYAYVLGPVYKLMGRDVQLAGPRIYHRVRYIGIAMVFCIPPIH